MSVDVTEFEPGMEVEAPRGKHTGCGPHNVAPRLQVHPGERGIVATREPDHGNSSLVPVWFQGRIARIFCRPSQLRIVP